MNNIVVSDNIKIENMIYEIRGKQVMLDSDLARLYGVETKRINEAVKNNIEKSIKTRRYFLAGAFIFLFIAIKMPVLHFLSNYFIYIDFLQLGLFVLK